MTLEELYREAAETPSDINQHVPLLRLIAENSEGVVEFGMRKGVSTTAILAGQPDWFTTYDLVEDPCWKRLAEVAGRTDFRFVQADVTKIEIPECDFLFEDSFHTYDHVSKVLELHSGKVRKYIAFHDTSTFGTVGEGGTKGIAPAIWKFVDGGNGWKAAYFSHENNGFMVIERT